MATRDEREAIKCSGYGATSGQSFRNQIAGAASAARLTDYRISGWPGWSSSPASQGSPGLAFPSGQVFNLSTYIQGGSRISDITRGGAGLLTLSNVSKPDSANVILQSSSVSTTQGVNVQPDVAASVQIISGYNSGARPGLTAGATYYYNGADQQSPPATGTCQADFSAQISGSGASDGGYDTISFVLNFQPNAGTGNFNDPLSQSFSMEMTHRDVSIGDYTIEWHDNDTYTHQVGGGPNYIADEATFAPSAPPSNGYTLWMRYMMPGDTTWFNYGPVTFYDQRISYY